MKKILIFLVMFCVPVVSFAETINFQSNPTDTAGYGQVSLQLYTDATAFTIANAATDATFTIDLEKSGSPTNNSMLTLWSDVAGTPTTLLYTSSMVSNSTLTGSCVPYTFTFSGMTLPAGTYHVAFGVDNTLSNTNKPAVCTADTDTFWTTTTTASTWTYFPYSYGGIVGYAVFSVSSGGGTTTEQFSTTTQLVDNPTQDFANGLYLFLFGLFGMIWLFSKKR